MLFSFLYVFKKNFLFMYLFYFGYAGSLCCMWAFSSCDELGLLSVAV